MLGRMVRTVERHRHNISNTCPQECVGNGARKVHGKRYRDKGTTRPNPTKTKRMEGWSWAGGEGETAVTILYWVEENVNFAGII